MIGIYAEGMINTKLIIDTGKTYNARARMLLVVVPWRSMPIPTHRCSPFSRMVSIANLAPAWEDLIRLAGSLKLGHLKAAGVMRILQVRDRPTTLAKALMHLGRLIKSLHILNYIDDAAFRRQILMQLNRQEFRHKLARKIYHGERGEVRNALRQGQEEQLAITKSLMAPLVSPSMPSPTGTQSTCRNRSHS